MYSVYVRPDEKEANFGSPCVNRLIYEKDSHLYHKAHVYSDFVNIRFIIMTFNRPLSLRKLRRSLQRMELDGHTGSVEIWIDRSPSGHVHEETLAVARSFCWTGGRTTVHVHSNHTGIYGQWFNPWNPGRKHQNSTELYQIIPKWGAEDRTTDDDVSTEPLAVMLEDDVDISRYAYRWLRAAHVKYGGRSDIYGYALQDENAILPAGRRSYLEISREDKDLVFGFTVPGTWGMAPHPARWGELQAWFSTLYYTPGYAPLLPEAPMYTSWYRDLVLIRGEETLPDLWFARFAHDRKLVTIFSNLPEKLGKSAVSLVANRKEAGLHYKVKLYKQRMLMSRWHEEAIAFPNTIQLFGYEGEYLRNITFL